MLHEGLFPVIDFQGAAGVWEIKSETVKCQSGGPFA